MNIRKRTTVAIALAAALIGGCSSGTPETMLASGKEYLSKKDNKAAVIQFKNALQQNADLPEARFLLGKALLETGDAAGAEKEFRKALALKYPADQVIPPLATSLVLIGDYKKALDEFSSAEISAPEAKAQLHTALGQAHLARGDRKAAEAAFATAVAAQPGYAPAALGQARLVAMSRDLSRALVILDTALAKSPNVAEAWQLKGDILSGQNDQQGAGEAYRKALAAKPDFLQAHAALINLFGQQKKLDEAAKQLESMKRVAPKHPQTLYLQALLAYREAKFAAARGPIQEQLRVAPDNLPGLLLAGAIEYELKSYATAENYLRKVLQQVPGQLLGRRLLAATYLRTGEVTKALDTLKPVLDKIENDPATLALAAEAYILSGDQAQAAQYFEKAAALESSEAKKQTAAGVSLLAKGHVEKGFRQLEQAAALDSGVQVDMALIAGHLQRREYDKALAAATSYEKKQPGAPAALLKGRVLFAANDIAGARRSFERALEIDPVYFPAVRSMAQLDVADKKPELARKRFETVLAKDPKHLQALLSLAELRVRNGGPSAGVAELLTKAVTAHPSEALPRLALVGYYIGAKDPKKAVATAQDALTAFPDQLDVLDAAGRAYTAAGDTNQALALYKKLAAKQSASPHPHMRMAEIHVSAGDTEAAKESLRAALNVAPQYVEAQRRLVALLLGSGQVREAITIAQEVQKQRPKEAVGYILEGDIYVVGKKWPEAQAAYRRGLKQSDSTQLAVSLYGSLLTVGHASEADQFAAAWFKDHPKDDTFRVHVANAAAARKDYASAVQQYRRLLDAHPNNATILNSLALASAQLKDPKAIEFAEQANKLAPDQPSIMNTLGTLLLDKGETARGVDLLRKASALAPQSADIRLSLAKALVQSGDKAAARRELDELTKLGDKFAQQSEVLKLRQGL
jgi:cellulose synthase operon protein C